MSIYSILHISNINWSRFKDFNRFFAFDQNHRPSSILGRLFPYLPCQPCLSTRGSAEDWCLGVKSVALLYVSVATYIFVPSVDNNPREFLAPKAATRQSTRLYRPHLIFRWYLLSSSFIQRPSHNRCDTTWACPGHDAHVYQQTQWVCAFMFLHIELCRIHATCMPIRQWPGTFPVHRGRSTKASLSSCTSAYRLSSPSANLSRSLGLLASTQKTDDRATSCLFVVQFQYVFLIFIFDYLKITFHIFN